MGKYIDVRPMVERPAKGEPPRFQLIATLYDATMTKEQWNVRKEELHAMDYCDLYNLAEAKWERDREYHEDKLIRCY